MKSHYIVRAAVERFGRPLLGAVAEEFELFAAFLERTPGFFVAWFSLIYTLGAIGAAYHRKLWLDEIISVYIVNLPTWSDIWRALLHTVDGNPPLYYLMARLFLFTGDVALATRLPAVIGFCVAAICVFVFMRRSTSTVAAAAAAVVFAGGGAFRWAVEGRPYGPMLGLTGLALVCWQRSVDPSRSGSRWLWGLGLTIACLVSTHYYGTLIVMVLVLGELVRGLVNKRWDWPVFAAIALGSSAILLWIPLLRCLRQNVASNAASMNYFAQPSLGHMYAAYDVLVSPLILSVLLCLSVLALYLRYERKPAYEVQEKLSAPGTAVILGLTFLPLLAYVIALFVTHTFVVRYVLAGALGIGMLFGLLLHRLVARRPAVGVFVLVILCGVWAAGMMLIVAMRDHSYEGTLSFLAVTDRKTPIVVAEGLLFAPLRHYAPADLRSRLFYVTDLPTAQRTTDTTNENIMLALRPWAPGAIVDLNEFLGNHRTFFLYYYGFSGNSSLNALVDRKCNVRLFKKSGSELLFWCDCQE